MSKESEAGTDAFAATIETIEARARRASRLHQELPVSVVGRPDDKPDFSQAFVTKDSGEREHFSTGMQRDTSQGKIRFDLMFPKGVKPADQIIVRFAELMTRGAVKYNARNWEQAATQEELDRYLESAIRHFMQWFLGMDSDEDHAAAVLFNIMGAEYVKARLRDG